MILALFIVAAALSVFLIAALVVGREARRLDAVAPRAVYDLVEATEFVADLLPSSTQGRLTPDELREMLVLHMRWLHAQGLQPNKVVDLPQEIRDVC